MIAYKQRFQDKRETALQAAAGAAVGAARGYEVQPGAECDTLGCYCRPAIIYCCALEAVASDCISPPGKSAFECMTVNS